MKKGIIAILVIVILSLIASVAYLYVGLTKQKEENREMQELAEMDKKEMENEYRSFAAQYNEMKLQINNDSIVAQLTKEQMRTQELLKELQQVKASDAREIARLKKELATVRAVLRDYVMQIDSLNRLNQSLTEENSRIKEQYSNATHQIEGLNSQRDSLNAKVAIAAQLDATGVQMTILKKNNKPAKKIKDCKTINVSFKISRNVTATNGQRTIYVRITTPTGETLTKGDTFQYENKKLAYSMRKMIEYSGEETPVSMVWNVEEFLAAGSYRVSIFADGHMIGSQTFSFK